MLSCMSKPKKTGRPRNPESKRSLGVDRHVSPREAFHMEPELHAAFMQYLASVRPTPDKSATLRAALEDFLQARGHWPPKT